MILEICANSYQSAINAQKAGADRIELCSELSVGGITPSYGLLQKVATDIEIPAHVLIRPRSGDFCYSDAEFEQMKTDISLCKKLGFQGIVSGVLLANATVDLARTKELIELSKPLSFTFHRAFDLVANPQQELTQLIDLKVDRILTSGQQQKAIDGLVLLKALQSIANNRIKILPGSGINKENIAIFKNSGFLEVHTSASKKISNNLPFFDSSIQTVSDVETIKKMLNIIKNA